jgi:CheY-like chemotaxis protein
MTTPKLLLADDSASVRKIVEMTFAAEGIDVTSVGDAQSAMLTFIDLQPDIVLLDVGLSGTSGYQICEMIKQDEGTKNIPVLLLVGAYEPFDEGLAKQSAADGYFTKPLIPIRSLVTEVRRLLGMPSEDMAESEGNTAADAGPQLANRDIEELYSTSLSPDTKPPTDDDLEDIYRIPNGDDDLIETSPFARRGSGDLNSEISWDEDMDRELWPPKNELRVSEIPDKQQPLDSATDDAEIQVPLPSEEEEEFEETASSGESAEPSEATAELTPVQDAYPATWPHVESQSTDREREWEQIEVDDQDEKQSEAESATGTEFEILPAVENKVQPASAELIEQITQRVIERLSDRVIRQIAQEAVPQIAEKLIREALEEEKKV